MEGVYKEMLTGRGFGPGSDEPAPVSEPGGQAIVFPSCYCIEMTVFLEFAWNGNRHPSSAIAGRGQARDSLLCKTPIETGGQNIYIYAY